jgi:DNA-binding MarR family transcriptional regulator
MSTTPPDDARNETRHENIPLANELRLACMRIARRIRFESDRELPPHQFSVLARLADRARTNSELAEIERVSAPSMKRTTNCLVEMGYVSRADDPTDGRQVILSLTQTGQEALQRIRRHRDEWMLKRLGSLTEDERELLARATEVLVKVASE